jgi:hypothetical protein
MGRPIASRYFGNRNTDGVGGEGVASVALGGTNNSTGYTTGAAVAFTAPQIAGGTTATGTLTANAGGYLTAVTVTNAGTGYTSAPTVTAPSGTLGTLTLTASLNAASTTPDAITVSAFLATADGGSSAVASDIVKQVGARRYTVRNAQGTGKVRLVTTVPAAGECRLTATDSDGNTYYVKKLESRTACLLPVTGTQFAEDDHVQWTLDSATVNVSVVIANN